MWLLLSSIFTFTFWALFGAYIFFDLYLDYPASSLPFFLLSRLIGIYNILAIVYCIVRFKSYKKSLIIASMIMYTVPLVGVGGFFFWLFFGFAM